MVPRLPIRVSCAGPVLSPPVCPNGILYGKGVDSLQGEFPLRVVEICDLHPSDQGHSHTHHTTYTATHDTRSPHTTFDTRSPHTIYTLFSEGRRAAVRPHAPLARKV